MPMLPLARHLATRLFAPTSARRDRALNVLERLSAVTHAQSSAEQLANHHERLPGGVNDWTVARGAMTYRSGVMRAVTDAVATPWVTNALHVLRLGAGLLLVTPFGSNRTRAVANLTCTGTHALLAPRHYYGADGSDHVAFMSQMLSFAARAAGRDPRVSDAVLWLASMQGVMSYAAAGWVKLAGEKWRGDQAVVGIMRTRTYGQENFWRLLDRFPLLNKVIGRGTLVLECSYPLIYLAGGRLTRPLLMASGSMHLGIAATMGLGRFVTAFGSMYGALAYTTQPRGHPANADRDDSMAVLTVVAGAGLVAALVGWTQRQQQQVRAGRPDEETVTTGTEAVLRVRRYGVVTVGPTEEQAGRPLVILENGLMAPEGFWGWTIRELAPHLEVLTYYRAGYGGSRSGPNPRNFGSMVSDLTDLVRAVGNGREVILVGHSLGGYLCHRVASEHPELISKCILVDSTHPHELRRSDQQRLGAETLLPSLRLSYVSLRLGLGWLLERPIWSYQVPPEVRAETLRMFRTPDLWLAAYREWRDALAEFDAVQTVPAAQVPLLVLTARSSIARDDAMLSMHRELAEAALAGKQVIVPRADHDSILTSQTVSSVTAAHIRDFASGVTTHEGALR